MKKVAIGIVFIFLAMVVFAQAGLDDDMTNEDGNEWVVWSLSYKAMFIVGYITCLSDTADIPVTSRFCAELIKKLDDYFIDPNKLNISIKEAIKDILGNRKII